MMKVKNKGFTFVCFVFGAKMLFETVIQAYNVYATLQQNSEYQKEVKEKEGREIGFHYDE